MRMTDRRKADRSPDPAEPMTVEVRVGTRFIKAGTENIRVPTFVEIRKLTDVTDELLLDPVGNPPHPPRHGPKDVMCANMIDTKRLTFDAAGDLCGIS
jgi:ribosomal protein L39E